MRRTAKTHRGSEGTTLIELVVAVSIMVVVMSTVLSILAPARLAFETRVSAMEALQNGRVLMDTLTRELSVARQITAVSEADDATGYIEFTDNDECTRRFGINRATDYVRHGPVGDLADLAGPVSQLQFTCYDPCDLNTPITDVNEIRLIKIEATLTNSDESGQDKVFKTSVFVWRDSDATSDLQGWWCLDDGEGTTALDSSGGNYHGTLKNMAGDEWVTGVLDGALEFQGSDYVDLPIGTLVAETTDCTVAMWISWAGASDTGQHIFDFGSSETAHMYLIANPDTDAYMRFAITDAGWGNEEIINASSPLDTGWHHVAVTIDDVNEVHTLYLNGAVVGQNTDATTNPSDLGETTENWLCRPQRADSHPLDGILDDVRFYNRALSAREISDLSSQVSLVRFGGFEEAMAGSLTTSLTIPTPSDEGPSTATVSFLGESVGSSFTVPSGSNRLLVFTAHAIGEARDPHPPRGRRRPPVSRNNLTLEAVTYGGKAMTKVQELMEERSGAYVVAYILNESDLASANGSTFVQTWSDTPDTTTCYSFAVDNAHQVSPLGNSDSRGHERDRELSLGLSTNEGDMAILAATAGNTGAYTVYDGFTETEELSMAPGDGVVGYKSADGDDVTPWIHHNNPKGQALIGFVIQADAGDPITTIQGDLLIAVLTVDRKETLEAPSEEGWTLLDQGTSFDNVTVGAWAKLASASESASHTFTWRNVEEGYGWIMRFTNCDSDIPLNAMEVLSGRTRFPPSPSVTTTVENTMILRIGGFRGDKITVGHTGLSDHTTITMNSNRDDGRASGGAAYRHQLDIGPSGSDTFELTDRRAYRTITIAIAPDTSGSGG